MNETLIRSVRAFSGLLALCMLLACGAPTEQSNVAGPSPDATTEQNKQVVNDLFTAIDAGDLDTVGELLPADFVLHALGMPDKFDRDFIFQAIKTFYQAFPDNTHEIEEMIAEGEKVAVRLTQYATHEGEYGGVSATGKKVTIPAIHMMRIVDGKIVEWWALEDNLGLMTQLGMQLVSTES